MDEGGRKSEVRVRFPVGKQVPKTRPAWEAARREAYPVNSTLAGTDARVTHGVVSCYDYLMTRAVSPGAPCDVLFAPE